MFGAVDIAVDVHVVLESRLDFSLYTSFDALIIIIITRTEFSHRLCKTVAADVVILCSTSLLIFRNY